MNSLQDMSARALSREADYPAVEWQGRWYTWGALRRTADRVRELLEASGAEPAARVALLPRNNPDVVSALFALIAAGRTIRMIHVYQSTTGITRDVLACRPAVVVGLAEDFSEELTSAMRSSGIAGIALEQSDVATPPGCGSSVGECEPIEERRIELLTSGTTGPPKPFAISYETAARHLVGTNMLDTGEKRHPIGLPPFFIYLSFSTITGLYLVLPSLMQGYRAVLADRFTVPLWRDFVRRHEPISVALPPPAVQMVLDADIPRSELVSLSFITIGAAPLDPAVQRAFEDHYGIPILLLYGATEFGGPVTFMSLDLHREWGREKLGSVGRPFGGAKLRVVDAETGAQLPPGEAGLLEVMTPRFGEQWIRTADLGLIDEDGFVFIRGRADGAIIRGGFKLLPDEIERALALHPAVAAAGVVGLDDKRVGQVPGAVVAIAPHHPAPSVTELEAHLRRHVPATHVPVVWRFVESLPYTHMLKVDRRALRQLLESAS